MSDQFWRDNWHRWPWSTPENQRDATIAGAVAHYDTARDLGVPDYDARKGANALLCRVLSIGEMEAAPILADALARRATARLAAAGGLYGHEE
jgi:hypothetical protein